MKNTTNAINYMVEVFKTNVQETHDAKRIARLLLSHFPESDVHFDLEDCDKVLRIEGRRIETKKVIKLIRTNGFACEELL